MHLYLDPEDVAVLAKVVDQASRRLGLKEENEKEVLALRVLACAADGERDFDKLLTFALGGGLVNAA